MKGLSQVVRITRDEQDDARATFATMDHSDIRGLATAFHLFFAGLPRSRNGDHPEGCPHKSVEDSPHRSLASPCRSGVQRYGVISSWQHLHGGFDVGGLSRLSKFGVMADIPDKARQLAGDGDTDLGLVEGAPHAQMTGALSRLNAAKRKVVPGVRPAAAGSSHTSTSGRRSLMTTDAGMIRSSCRR